MERMTQLIRIIAAFFIAAMATACGSGPRSAMVDGCMDQGAPKDMCTCSYDLLEGRYGEETLAKMVETGVAPPRYMESIMEAGERCLSEGTPRPLGPLETEKSQDEEPDPVKQAEGLDVRDRTPAIQEVAVGADAAKQDANAIETAIRVIASSEAGSEHTDSRGTVQGDLNGDGANDVAVFFTVEIESENSYKQFVAAFLRQPDGLLQFSASAPAGTEFGETVDGISIEKGSIKLSTLMHGEDDAACCPSVRGKAEYLLHNARLRRVDQ